MTSGSTEHPANWGVVGLCKVNECCDCRITDEPLDDRACYRRLVRAAIKLH